MEYSFKYKFVKIAPRKIRLITNLVKNMLPNEALAQLRFLNKDAAIPVYELLKSAMASCKNDNVDIDNLFIKRFTCDGGPALKRRRYKSRGRAAMIKKHSSHISLVLAIKEASKPKSKATVAPKPIKKEVPKEPNKTTENNIDINKSNSIKKDK